MAILRSLDGRFFEIPDDQVDRFLIPADQVKAKLDAAGTTQSGPPPASSGPPPGPGGGPPPLMVLQIFSPSAGPPSAPPPMGGEQPAGAEVQPYYWNAWWHNIQPGWNAWWHNVHR